MTASGSGVLWKTLGGLLVLGLAAGLGWGWFGGDEATARRLARALVEASPVVDPGDAAAHQAAAERLAKLQDLSELQDDAILWGGHRAGRGYKPEDSHLTTLNPLVWRRMYLSLFMFTGEYSVEEADGYTLVHLPASFRNELEPGAYPYPFWHATKKWDNYQRATAVTLLLEDGRLVAGYRSDKEDPSRPALAREWDGRWQWTAADGQPMPHVTLFHNLLSKDNPHVSALDAAYRAFEVKARELRCMHCHSPDNIAKGNPLVILNYPNQALSGRHEIIAELEDNEMPPANAEEGTPAGIADTEQRTELMRLGREFARIGDEALAHEGQLRRAGS